MTTAIDGGAAGSYEAPVAGKLGRVPAPFIAAFVGGALAVAIVFAYSGGRSEKLAFGDGLIYRYVASHISAAPDEIDPIVVARGTSIRYGRIGLPAATWVASAGKPSAMPVGQAAVLVLAAAAAAAAVATLFPQAGLFAALLPFAAPGLPLSIVGGYAEPLAVAFGLWAIVFARRSQLWASAGVLSLAILTKENAAVVFAGLALWMVVRRRWRDAAILSTSLVPVLGWYGFIALRYGHIPILDPYLSRASEFPGLAVVHSLTNATSTGSAVTALLHVGLVAIAFALARKSIYGLIASIAGIQVLFATPFMWKWIGDAARISVFIQLFAVLALFVWWRPENASQEDSALESRPLLPAGARA